MFFCITSQANKVTQLMSHQLGSLIQVSETKANSVVCNENYIFIIFKVMRPSHKLYSDSMSLLSLDEKKLQVVFLSAALELLLGLAVALCSQELLLLLQKADHLRTPE